ncbi:calcium-binding protein, putative [Entamoeba dispar SAW760]|uniref:Calcium-binding protein, putative n=1 Tax=Entamoeba dispar (strain ATCC PRA-260 / SAW760) TaxID=370354 RepID=B0E5Y2_ENTDS|nr:calcium-binding protein, putative [Entamoeba dispar SAW760]EDR30100.1 calcium-binding protein, putative [Entamoeba dispar SAW760]|eukprot:EDR30100.1 calcium-binding protein, putative [Entamoeba dispar SAW760]
MPEDKPQGKTIEEFFAEIDLDNDGSVNADEYFSGVKMWRKDITDDDKPSQTLLFHLADLNDDGEIDIRQFARLIAILNRGFGKDIKSVFTAVFRLLDIKDQGKIGAPELERLLKKMGLQIESDDIEGFMDQVDQDLDGFITLKEFLAHFVKEPKDGQ